VEEARGSLLNFQKKLVPLERELADLEHDAGSWLFLCDRRDAQWLSFSC
jgi:hypothetical protein